MQHIDVRLGSTILETGAIYTRPGGEVTLVLDEARIVFDNDGAVDVPGASRPAFTIRNEGRRCSPAAPS